MASQVKPSSRWGSFLQQAVAGVESRLDTILADDDGIPVSLGRRSGSSASQTEHKEGASISLGANNSGGISRQSSTSKQHDRLQERLAKAVVSRNNAKSTVSSAVPSGNGSPIRTPSSARSSFDVRTEELHLGQLNGLTNEDIGLKDPHIFNAPPRSRQNDSIAHEYSSVDEIENATLTALKGPNYLAQTPPYSFSADMSPSTFLAPPNESVDLPSTSEAKYEQSSEQVNSEIAETRRQEESYQYLEHIDALQAKLQYLTREAAEFAKNAAKESTTGSDMQQLALKDEKIALLLEEGQKLSQNEMKHLMTVRKLRAKSLDDEKRLAQAKREVAEGEKVNRALQEKLREVENVRREELERLKQFEKNDKELERIKSLMALKTSQTNELQDEVDHYKNSGAAEEATRYKELLDTERTITSNLRDEIAIANAQKDLCDDRHRSQLRDVQAQNDRDKERARVIELDLKGELQVMESRFETYRARVEEVSSKGAGDVQAKLIRQIETLQGSYSVASENWMGIENSLLARIAGLEKEREDLTRKESDLRRRVRDATTKYRELESQQEALELRFQDLESNLSREKKTSSNLQTALIRTTTEAESAQSRHKSAIQEWETRLEHLEAERQENAPETISAHSRGPSPVIKPNADRASPTDRRPRVPSVLGPMSISLPFPDRPMFRRTSGKVSSYSFLPYRQDPATSAMQGSARDIALETPSIQMENLDDMFDGVVTPATPEKTINDMFSVSTAAAGPSVQLVERMSAAVRRLETEKAASQEELDLLATQRDEAREQVVTLMREVENKRAIDAKLVSLEVEVAEAKSKLDTTLEMLGEKSELVEELRADIVDMKEIYRSTLENTV